MTYIYMDAEGVQTLITNLQTYSSQAETSRSDVSTTNWKQKYAADLRSFSGDVTTHKGLLDDQITEVQTRLDAAKAANETGITSTGEDGKIAYYVPDGQQDTKQVVIDSNNVETARQAWADAETAVDYSKNGCTTDQWDTILASIQSHQDDPAYANALLASIGKGDLLDLPTNIADCFQNTHQHEGTTYSERPDAGTDLADALGHALAAASNTWSTDKANDYANGLVDAAEEKGKDRRICALNDMLLASQEADIDGDGAAEQTGLDYNDDMLVTLAQRLEGFDPEDVGFFDRENWDLGRVELPVVGPKQPLAGIVHAMTGNAAAGDTWLTVHNSDGSVDPDQTAEHTSSLASKSPIGDNQWTNDWTLLAAQEAIAGNSGDPAVGDGTSQAAIVSGALDAVGEGGSKVTLSDAARNASSIALSSYPYGFQVSARQDDETAHTLEVEGGSWAEGMPDQPLLTNKALANLVGQIGENDAALTRLAGSQEAFNKIQTAGEKGDSDSQTLSTVLMDQSSARGFVTGAIARQHEGDAEAADKRVGAWAKAASTAVSAVPLPQTKGAGAILKAATTFAMNAGKSAASDGAEKGAKAMFGGKEDKTKSAEESVKAAGTSSSTITGVLALLDNGVYSQEELAERVATNKGQSLKPILNEDGSLKINPSVASDSLTSDQQKAILQLAGRLPADGHGALEDIGQDIENQYSKGYDAAHDQ